MSDEPEFTRTSARGGVLNQTSITGKTAITVHIVVITATILFSFIFIDQIFHSNKQTTHIYHPISTFTLSSFTAQLPVTILHCVNT